MGTKAYLSCTLYEELVDGHCLIVPIQHHLTMLEADDDVWDEVKVTSTVYRESFFLTTSAPSELHEMSHPDGC